MQVGNADFVAREINDYRTDVERKLKGMVESFAFAATRAIQQNIPVGNQAAIEAGKSGVQPEATYRQLYQLRENTYGIEMQAGYHRGALKYSEDGSFEMGENVLVTDAYDAANAVYDAANSYYEIGDTFYIGAEGPAYDLLENNSSPQTNGNGIMRPSEEMISEIYRSDMKTFYDNVK